MVPLGVQFGEPKNSGPCVNSSCEPRGFEGSFASGSQVRRLWEYTMLYAMKEKINIWSNTLSKNWKTSKSHFMSGAWIAPDFSRCSADESQAIMSSASELAVPRSRSETCCGKGGPTCWMLQVKECTCLKRSKISEVVA